MTKRRQWCHSLAVAVMLLSGGYSLGACNDDSADEEEDTSEPSAVKDNGGGKGGSGGKSDAVAGKGGAAGGDAQGCDGKDGCYACEPAKNEQFLNACGDLTCNPYDNSKLSKLVDGKVPELP